MARPRGPNARAGLPLLPVGSKFHFYIIDGVLAQGSLGTTYLCRHDLLDSQMVLKIPVFSGPDAVAPLDRFLNAALAVASPPHPSICPIYQAAVYAGWPLLARNFVEGEPLSSTSFDRDENPRASAVKMVIQVALALGQAHHLGIAHLGLKPSNIVIEQGGNPVIIDCGMTLAAEPSFMTRLETEAPLRAFFYLSPEQIARHSASIGPASDIYSLGLILYELLCGELPVKFLGTVMVQVPSPPSEFRSSIDTALDAICLKAIEADPRNRYASMSELAADLEKWLISTAPDLEKRTKPPSTSHQPDPRARLDRVRRPRAMLTTDYRADSLEMPIVYDEDVQFTVYRPKTVQPEIWYDLLAFAHLSQRRPDAPPDELDPVQEVQRQAERLLAERADRYQDVTQDSRQSVPREGEITFLPEVDAFTFNPERRVFRWVETVHTEVFRFKAARELDGRTVRGRMTVFLGPIILAEVTLSIRVDSRIAPTPSPQTRTPQADHARPYRKIFASYSHQDVEIVHHFEQFATTLGDEFLRDAIHLRSGQVWNEQLEHLIREADIFQLFWSSNAMRSRYVREEWEYALSLSRPHFVRPTYWEDPLPTAEQEGLPPEVLRRIHFQRVMFPGSAPLPNRPSHRAMVSIEAPATINVHRLDYREPPPSMAQPEMVSDEAPAAISLDRPYPRSPAPSMARRSPYRRSLVRVSIVVASLILLALPLAFLTLRSPSALVSPGTGAPPEPGALEATTGSGSTGTLRIDAADHDLDISIDGMRIAEHDVREPIDLTAGTHEVEVRRGNKLIESRTISVRSGQTETINVNSNALKKD